MNTDKLFFLGVSFAVITGISIVGAINQTGEDIQESIEVKEQELELHEERIEELRKLRERVDVLIRYNEELEEDNEDLKNILKGGD